VKCGEPRSEPACAKIEERLDVARRYGVSGQPVACFLTRSGDEALVDRRRQALAGDCVMLSSQRL
jgi:hypothetical protein